MQITLCDTNIDIINACKDIDGITVEHGKIFDMHYDALITPGNSFAFMDGNFDALVTQRYGTRIQEEIQDTWIAHCGEISVGNAVSVWVDSKVQLIYAPTMRVPMNIVGTINAYLAIRAGLRQAVISKRKRVVMPAFGTGCGGLSPETYARQLKAALNDYNKNSTYGSWREAQAYHFSLV